MVDTHKLIGRKAKPCGKCGGHAHFINRLGGIQCSVCSPAKNDTDAVENITIMLGVWVPVGFDGDVATIAKQPISASTPSGVKSVTRKPGVALPSNLRDHSGGFSENEVQLFTSELIWGNPDCDVVLKPPVRQEKPIGPPPAAKTPGKLPAVGSVIETRWKIPTFAGFIPRGSRLTIESANHDGIGDTVVSLSENGRLLVSGMVLPSEGI